MNCKKCNSNRTDWAEQVRLIGGVSARLCINCVNAFDRHVRLMPLWSEMESVNDAIEDVKIAAYGREEPTEKLAPLRARARAIERKWRAIGYEWLGIVVDERCWSSFKSDRGAIDGHLARGLSASKHSGIC
jgi:hypothetical protein